MLKKLFKNKNGIAVESALWFMVAVFSLCALLTSITLIGHYQTKIENLTLLTDVQIDQIGEDYLASVKADEEFTSTYEKFAYEVSGNTLTVWRKTDENKKAALYVEAERTADGQVSVKAWRYSIPTNAVGE